MIARPCAATTDRAFWQRYWARFEPFPVEDVLFSDLLARALPERGTFIEVGGFPGVFAVYCKKRGLDVTLFDFYVDRDAVSAMERINRLPAHSIQVIEADFLSYNPAERYDVVFSAGFIEHFEDPSEVLRKHVELLADGGLLFLSAPNLRGANGWVQRWLDPDNYRAHNLAAMRPQMLRDACRSLGLQAIDVSYYGRPQLWLEWSAPVSRVTRSAIHRLSRLLRRIDLRNRLLSPHLVLLARKGRETAVRGRVSDHA